MSQADRRGTRGIFDEPEIDGRSQRSPALDAPRDDALYPRAVASVLSNKYAKGPARLLFEFEDQDVSSLELSSYRRVFRGASASVPGRSIFERSADPRRWAMRYTGLRGRGKAAGDDEKGRLFVR